MPVSPMLEELVQLAQSLPEDRLESLVAEVRLLSEPKNQSVSSWPPAWFGSIKSGKSDIARNVDMYLAEGFGR